ncbi:hypothetical protein AA23498_0082 [Acetobacter nitrogenifigens DSM 23921 = NBRC 105050]|uniref:TVP38/TMEM64 family membrane protein n=1 Tax=Acetobacter nitrogenifigens DSM 23921 = NBRC 105050 TaxID=1120919 RepID=A0A511X8X9_9PROT|nr:VTT domain-containing protein [Acetobacter nitrogenifigens]GBQ87240.1 hypothetical protein AA23498_0082 [Acetobacter nitrogenifigens DSM 23921 = NBRC 105050]GEN59403.1 hypothetical protein ANI02nite_12870 [Acetobacter nitrogenifigens DSM 23921 = NBRC 105050]
MTRPPDALRVPRPAAGPAGPRVLLRPALMLLALTVGAVLLREFPSARHILDSPALLRAGVSGRVAFLLCGAVWCAFGLPRQALCFAGGVAYGVWEGSVLSVAATLVGCVLAFGWARWGGREAAARWLSSHDPAAASQGGGLRARVSRMDRAIQTHPFTTILTLRLLPVGSSLLLNILAGLSGARVLPFAAATALGAAPQTVVFVLLGAGAQIGGGGRIAVGCFLFAASGLLGLWLLRSVGETDRRALSSDV